MVWEKAGQLLLGGQGLKGDSPILEEPISVQIPELNDLRLPPKNTY